MTGLDADFIGTYAAWILAMAFAGCLGGILAGLLGVGGGIIIVPVLFFVLDSMMFDIGLSMKVAVATSLASIILTSIASTRSHHRRGAVDFTLLKTWSPSIVVGVVIGTVIAGFVNGQVLTAVFAIVALLVAFNMALQFPPAESEGRFPGPVSKTATGLIVGGISAMMGIGGGTLSVPILTYFKFDIRKAVGTASAIGFMIAIPATIGYVIAGWHTEGLPVGSAGYVNLIAVAVLAPLTMLTAPLGTRIAHAIPRRLLAIAFAVFLVGTSIRMFMTFL